ncbi:MAG: hypothetical protein HYU42_09940 [Candidatus Rokubacteria bacterium]|nr:hypothetical protein [Candidatus Rokubacteria bacterium]
MTSTARLIVVTLVSFGIVVLTGGGPAAAAIANAVADAFGGRLRILHPVLSPERVHALLAHL